MRSRHSESRHSYLVFRAMRFRGRRSKTLLPTPEPADYWALVAFLTTAGTRLRIAASFGRDPSGRTVWGGHEAPSLAGGAALRFSGRTFDSRKSGARSGARGPIARRSR